MRRLLPLVLVLLGACGPKKLEPVARPAADAAPALPDVGSFGLQPAVDAGDEGFASCATETIAAQRSAADLLLLVDIGPTIHEPFAGATESRYLTVKKALLEFLNDPQSAGLGVALQFFPFGYIDKPCLGFRDCGRDGELVGGGSVIWSCIQKRFCAFADQPPGSWVNCATGLPPGPCDCRVSDTCSRLSGGKPTTCVAVGECSASHVDCPELGKACPGGMAGDTCQPHHGTCLILGDACDATMYEELAVPFGDLPGSAKPMLDRLDLTDVQAGFSSPTTAAVTGAIAALKKRAALPGARPSALVLVTEARQAERVCSPADPLGATTVLSAAATGKPAIPTYVVGLVSATQTTGRDNLNKLATAGGTGMPFVLDKADGALASFQKALDDIRTSALPCQLEIPAAKAAVDYARVNVTLSGANVNGNISYTRRADACQVAGGWYYDADPALGGKPAHIVLCPATCQAIKGDATAKAQVVLGCATRVIQ